MKDFIFFRKRFFNLSSWYLKSNDRNRTNCLLKRAKIFNFVDWNKQFIPIFALSNKQFMEKLFEIFIKKIAQTDTTFVRSQRFPDWWKIHLWSRREGQREKANSYFGECLHRGRWYRIWHGKQDSSLAFRFLVLRIMYQNASWSISLHILKHCPTLLYVHSDASVWTFISKICPKWACIDVHKHIAFITPIF